LLSRFLFVFAITIPFDIRDMKYDESKIRTIPIIFGEPKSKWIAVLVLILAQLIVLVQLIYFDMPIHFLIAMLCLFLLASLSIINSSENKSKIYYCFWVESMSVFCYLFLILSTLLI
jgi:4-hydroxybenzoate polyprenyltransferase